MNPFLGRAFWWWACMSLARGDYSSMRFCIQRAKQEWP